MQVGYVQVYTGNGKGKTTAMLGLVLRAVGAGHRVYIGQFIKDSAYSEIKAVRELLPTVTLEQYGAGKGCFIRREPAQEDVLAAREGLEKARAALTSGAFDVVAIDEIHVAAHMGLIAVEDILSLIESKPRAVELILTGRYAHERVVEKADLVTEMNPVKHYYERGIQARKGIEC